MQTHLIYIGSRGNNTIRVGLDYKNKLVGVDKHRDRAPNSDVLLLFASVGVSEATSIA